MRRMGVGLERVVQQMWQQIATAEVNIERDEEGIINRLHASRAVLQMAIHIELDEEMGEVPGAVFYPRMMGTRALADLRLPPYKEEPAQPSPTCGMAHTRLPTSPQHPPLPQPEESSEPGPSRPAPHHERQRQRRVRCFFCHTQGHRLDDCPAPHTRCSALHCRVPNSHALFRRGQGDCPFW